MDYLRIYMDVLNNNSNSTMTDIDNSFQIGFINKGLVNLAQIEVSNLPVSENPDLLLNEFQENIKEIDKLREKFEDIDFDAQVKEMVQKVLKDIYSKSQIPLENLTPFQENILFYIKRNLEIQEKIKKLNPEKMIDNEKYKYIEKKKRAIFALEEVTDEQIFDKKKIESKEMKNFKENLNIFKKEDDSAVNEKFKNIVV